MADPEYDLYSIPSYTSWFSWQSIHEVERLSLREFFDGSSITRTPRIYKEYRDFIITTYREDPTRKLSFTEVRKSLVGDISVLHKVFTFLEKWGLINFDPSNTETPHEAEEEDKEDDKWRIRVEEGAPHGVRVVAAPNSLKPLLPLPSPVIGGRGGDVVNGAVNVSPLASYSDVYGELMEQEKKENVVCESCKEQCASGHYRYNKDASVNLCEKCFKGGNYDKNKLPDEFKLMDGGSGKAVWTEAETLLLLESVLKHGDDWDLVVQNVKTKSKLDCISKLIQLPFGDLMLGSVHGKIKSWDNNAEASGVDQVQRTISEPGETAGDQSQQHNHKHHQNGDAETETPPKRLRRLPTSEASSFLMEQVARIASAVGPQITASAAEAAVTALCYENQCSTDIFNDDDDDALGSPDRGSRVESAVGEEKAASSEAETAVSQRNTIPLTLRMRAATATAIGAAAAHAKLLADQEEREVEYLVSTLVEAQVKKLQRKMKHVEALNLIMEKQHSQMKDLEECIIGERVDILQKIFSTGVSRWRDQASVKSQSNGVA